MRRLLAHTADLRAELLAPDRAGLYQAAADLVREVVAGDSPVEGGEERTIELPPAGDAERFFRFVRELVTAMEQSLVDVLASYGVEAAPKADAPGVYVKGDKIASLGLRVSRGCSFHGLAFNVDMDMSPFMRINPCGYAGLKMVQLKDLIETPPHLDEVAQRLEQALRRRLGYTQ